MRDVQDEKHRVAALKNAYVLMGKHRHELAATFFILGGDINSAAKICAKNLNDPQLALVICSLMEGVNGPIGQDIILKYALPIARDTRDSWLASMLQVGQLLRNLHIGFSIFLLLSFCCVLWLSFYCFRIVVIEIFLQKISFS